MARVRCAEGEAGASWVPSSSEDEDEGAKTSSATDEDESSSSSSRGSMSAVANGEGRVPVCWRELKLAVEADEPDAPAEADDEDEAVGWNSEASEACDMEGVCERPACAGASESSVARLSCDVSVGRLVRKHEGNAPRAKRVLEHRALELRVASPPRPCAAPRLVGVFEGAAVLVVPLDAAAVQLVVKVGAAVKAPSAADAAAGRVLAHALLREGAREVRGHVPWLSVRCRSVRGGLSGRVGVAEVHDFAVTDGLEVARAGRSDAGPRRQVGCVWYSAGQSACERVTRATRRRLPRAATPIAPTTRPLSRAPAVAARAETSQTHRLSRCRRLRACARRRASEHATPSARRRRPMLATRARDGGRARASAQSARASAAGAAGGSYRVDRANASGSESDAQDLQTD